MKILGLIALIALNAVFACIEIAVISFNDTRLQRLAKQNDKRAMRLLKITESPAKFLSVIQIGITLAGMLASAFAAETFASALADFLIRIGVGASRSFLNFVCVFFITVVLGYFTLVFGELIPKRIGMKKAESIALRASGLIYGVAKFFSPAVWLLSASTNGILRLLGFDPADEGVNVTEEEIRMLIDEGTEKGVIDADEKRLINNIFEFDAKSAGEVMTHRTDVDMLWLEESDEVWEESIVNSRHSYYPICDGTFDDIIGVLNVKEYFRLKDKSRDAVLKEAVTAPQLVPETVRTDFLFRKMRESKHHFAIVLDDYGGMSGIITINDLLEEIVGNLDDGAGDEVEPKIEKTGDSTWEITGAVTATEIVSQLGVNIDVNEYETFGGLVFGSLGSIPEDGATLEIDCYDMKINILEIKDHRLMKSKVTLLKPVASQKKTDE
jgi:putative hemolysin